MLFYVEHVLRGSKTHAGIVLLTYFIAGAASVPLWLILSKRLSKAAAWFVGMALTAVAMSGAVFLGPSHIWIFVGISAITGLGLGADYGLPPSILADIINAREGADTRGETGAYFGLWALATKLATAVGAAFSLPVAAWLGFDPGSGKYNTFALVFVYIVLPVVVKVIAALMIWFIRIEAERSAVRFVLRGEHP
jgi:Na+/melibiose symporter-like transporter